MGRGGVKRRGGQDPWDPSRQPHRKLPISPTGRVRTQKTRVAFMVASSIVHQRGSLPPSRHRPNSQPRRGTGVGVPMRRPGLVVSERRGTARRAKRGGGAERGDFLVDRSSLVRLQDRIVRRVSRPVRPPTIQTLVSKPLSAFTRARSTSPAVHCPACDPFGGIANCAVEMRDETAASADIVSHEPHHEPRRAIMTSCRPSAVITAHTDHTEPKVLSACGRPTGTSADCRLRCAEDGGASVSADQGLYTV